MKTLLVAILGFSFVIGSCASSKSRVAGQYEQIAKCPEKEEVVESLKRHNRW